MAELKQVDLQIGTEAQFESKKETLPVGTFVGITDPIHKSDLDSDLQVSIDSIANKLNKPSSNPTEDSVITVSSTGTVGTKKLSELEGGGLSLSDIYPIGSIYMSVNNVSPVFYFGGTWERIKDRFLLAAGDTYSAGLTGGEATHTLTVDEMPKHSHNLPVDKNYGEQAPTEYDRINLTSGTVYQGFTSEKTGENQPHNNMPPYLTVYMWKRVS